MSGAHATWLDRCDWGGCHAPSVWFVGFPRQAWRPMCERHMTTATTLDGRLTSERIERVERVERVEYETVKKASE